MLKIRDDVDLKELEKVGFKPKYNENTGKIKAKKKKKKEQEIKESNNASDKWFNKMIKQDEKFLKERKQLECTIDKLITALAEETGTNEDYISKTYLGEDK